MAGLLRLEQVLDALSDGVAVVDFDLHILRANRAFALWCGGDPVGRGFYEALGFPRVEGDDYCPFHTALLGQTASARLQARDGRSLQLQVTPLVTDEGEKRLVALCRDVTRDRQQMYQLDALYRAGRELADLPAEQLTEMPVEERVELLKQNIRRFTHDLLHYDVIEIRLLDRRTNRLEPLLSEGMTPEASARPLLASPQDHGVTGFVAATGKSYLCPDTASDPIYLEGARGARSSLTMPLIYQEQVIGTFNVESPRENAFDESDQRFLEIFCREIASALHTLDLLTTEQREATSKAVEAIAREVALPVDDILAAGAFALERYIGHDTELADRLRIILARTRTIKQMIHKVGEDLTVPPPLAQPAPAEPPPFKGLRVLVADNDERVRRSAHTILGRWGCVVETARDGQEALTLARLSTYDAILADIRLPDLDGYEVYSKLRQTQPAARVVLMTSYGYDPTHSLVKARQDGLRQVLFKPFRIDQLRDALTGCAKSEPVA